MATLLFDRKYKAEMELGTKTTTWRCWVRQQVKEGDQFKAFGTPYKVTKVERRDPETLTDEDARLDGWPTAAALKEQLSRRYKDTAGRTWFRITFEHIAP